MTLQSLRTDARRGEILRAALTVFLEHGVEGASIEEIRRSSGASIGSIYHHFDNKEGIAAALYVEALSHYQSEVLAALVGRRSARAGVKAVVVAHLDWIRSDPDLARYLLMDRGVQVRAASKDRLGELNATLGREVMAWLRPRIDASQIRDLPFEVLFALWVGPAQELSRHLLVRHQDPTPAVVDVLAECAWTSLSATSTADRPGSDGPPRRL